MPTAAKLVSAVFFALLGFLAVHLYMPHLPQEIPYGVLREYAAALGLIIGWWVMGRLAGRGYTEALGSGIRTSVTLVFWALLLFSLQLMIKRSYRMLYDGPMEAVVGVFALMLEYGRELFVADVLVVVFVGGAIGGLMAEWAGKRWS